MTTPWEEVNRFWIEAGPKKWFQKNDDFDTEIKRKFEGMYEEAAAGSLDHWAADPQGCLALILLLDQFSRNMFRDTPKMFATDRKALELASLAIDKDYPQALPEDMRPFVAMPFMHSEDVTDQERSVELQRKLGGEENVKYAILHLDVIRRFGRFPHRNSILGRTTTPEEQAYLDDGGGF